MDKNAKYKDMEKRIKTLENDLDNYRKKNNEINKFHIKYNTILKNANEAILVIQEGELKFVNNLAAEIAGISQKEISNRSFLQWVHPDDQEIVIENQLKRLKNEKVPNDYDIRVIDKNQKVIWVNIRPVVIEWEGQPAVLIFMTDINRRKHSEEDLRVSEAKYRAILDGIEEGYYEVDFTGKFTFVSDKLCKIVQLSSEELLGKNNREFNTPETAKKIFKIFNKVYRTGKSANVESFEFITKEKDQIRKMDLELSVSLMRDPHGNPSGFRGIVRDVSERIKSEKALQDSEERYRSLVENTMDGYFICKIPSTKFIFLNQRACDIFGYTMQEGMGLKVWDVISSEDHERVMKRVQKRLEGKKLSSERQMYTAMCKDGSTFRTELSTSLVTFKGEAAIQGVLRDITEQQHLENQLHQAQKMEAIGTLAGGIAHDFNNLLMSILGYNSLMKLKTDTSHPHYEHLVGIEKCVESSTKLTKQLLGFAREGKYEVKPTNLNKLVKDQNRMFRRTKKEITIHSKYEENLWTAEVDSGQIEQVLLNIYVNAWQAMPDGGELHIQTENIKLGDDYKQPFHVAPGKYVKISVTDTGIGMNEETQKKIFDPFFTTREKERGTGMGLSSAYGIIKNHGGFITVYSEPNEGSTFNIYFPASVKKVKKHKKPLEKLIRGSGTILMIDDEKIVLDVGKEMIKALGYDVLIAKNGNEGIKTYKKYQEKIDMVILDMIMPGTTGSDVYDSLKEINQDIKVLLASGYSINKKANKILERGCNGFIQKPFNIERLSQEIREILS